MSGLDRLLTRAFPDPGEREAARALIARRMRLTAALVAVAVVLGVVVGLLAA